jgi:adenylate cyclase class 2
MALSRRENEIKLAFPAAAAAVRALTALGATEVHPRTFEDNVLYDHEQGRLNSRGALLRLRSYGSITILTYKGAVEGVHRHKVRVEHETEIEDVAAAHSILEGLGFQAVYRYQKYRTMFRLGRISAVVDETPLGTFVELEGDPGEVDQAAAALGFKEADYVTASYRELQEEDAARRGVSAGDLLMPSEETGP